jgi:uncharacterized integral membrane protein
MRGASYGLIVLGIIVLIFGLINHELHIINFPSASTYIAGVGVVIAIIGGALLFLGGARSSAGQ